MSNSNEAHIGAALQCLQYVTKEIEKEIVISSLHYVSQKFPEGGDRLDFERQQAEALQKLEGQIRSVQTIKEAITYFNTLEQT